MAADEASKVDEIRTKEAVTAVNVKTQEKDDQKYKSEPAEKTTFKHYTRIFSYATRWDLFFLAIGASASMGAGAVLPAMVIVFGKLVGNFQGFSSGDAAVPAFNKQVSDLALALVYLFIGKFVAGYIAMYTFRVVGIRISAAVRLAYMRALFSQSIGNLDKLPPGHAASTITTVANVLQTGISERLCSFIMFTTLLVASYIISFIYSWRLTLVASSILVFCVAVFGIIVPFSIKFQKSFDHANEKASSIASEVFSSVRMVVACGAEKRVAESYSRWMDEARRRGLKLSPVFGLQLAPLFFAIYGDFALTFWCGVKFSMQGQIDGVSDVIIVLFSIMMSVMSLGSIAAPLASIGKAASAAATFFAMIDAPQMERKGLSGSDVNAHRDINFKKVTFAYPSRPHVKVLDELDVTFEVGKLTAIVGPSGSGKSTIVGLLERWYQLVPEEADPAMKESNMNELAVPEKTDGADENSNGTPIIPDGEVSIGDHKLDSLDLKWWRSQIGLVQQEPHIFNDTIFNNVAHGLVGSKFENADADTKKQLVEEACHEAFADEFITKLPEAYNTKVGDSGVKLSGGQRQRIAIARSIIKRPPILIFDEATSSIDVRGERLVQEALDRAAKNRTTITIAHRLSTIRKADKIVVLAKGKAIEQGTHEELLEDENGVYYGLVYAQQLTLGDSDNLELKEASIQESVTAGTASEGEAAKKRVESIEAPYKTKSFIQSFGLLIVEQRKQLVWFILSLVGAMMAAAAYPMQAFLLAKMILVFNYEGQKLINDTQYWALMFTALACTSGVAYFIVGWASSTLSTLVACSYRQEYFENAILKPIPFFDEEENSSGTLTSRLSNDPTQIQEMLGLNMAMVIVAAFYMIGCTAISFAFGWKLTLVTFFAAVPVILAATFVRIRFETQLEKLNALVFAESSQFAAEAIGASRTVAALTLEATICDRFAALLQDHVNIASKKARYSQAVFALSDSASLLAMALVFWYGCRLIINGEYDANQFFVIYTAMIYGSEAAGQWCTLGPNIAQAAAAANRILSFRVRGGSDPKPSSKLAGHDDNSENGPEIAFQNVYFRYPTRDVPIFAGLNLTIKKGQFAGIVGASGCGKTTAISLLEQFYQPDKGTITLDGINIADFNRVEYRKSMSLVAQEPTLFQGTIQENILLAVDSGSVTDDDLHTACRDAEIHDFIVSLPDGYSTDIGSKGVALSGGQKQRIAIARALIRNPRILLLDEATSSLDSESEKLVQAAFERAGKGRTMVVVCHRLATVQNADVIFVLGKDGDGAKVLEKGTHHELVARRGLYYQMCKSQALDQ